MINNLLTAIYNKFNQQSLDVGPAVNVGGGVVGIPCTGHGFATGDHIVLTGTTNYDGDYTVLASSTADQINITATYSAETFAATDYVQSAFYDTISGRLYYNKAVQSADFPYCVYSLVSNVNELGFSDEHEDFLVQFNLFSQNNSAQEVGNMLLYLQEVYDDCDLTVTGWRDLYMKRNGVFPNSDITQVPPIMGYTVQYEVLLERAR